MATLPQAWPQNKSPFSIQDVSCGIAHLFQEENLPEAVSCVAELLEDYKFFTQGMPRFPDAQFEYNAQLLDNSLL